MLYSAAQTGHVRKNLTDAMDGKKDLVSHYDGYTSCPLVTGYHALKHPFTTVHVQLLF